MQPDLLFPLCDGDAGIAGGLANPGASAKPSGSINTILWKVAIREHEQSC